MMNAVLFDVVILVGGGATAPTPEEECSSCLPQCVLRRHGSVDQALWVYI